MSPDTDTLHAEVAAHLAAKRAGVESRRRLRAFKKALARARRARREHVEPTAQGQLLAQRAARRRELNAVRAQRLRARRKQAKEKPA